MLNFNKKIRVCTHDGHFHADDVFACAVLLMWARSQGKKIEIIRTRDPKLVDNSDIVVDVGGLYNEKLNRFDHHQEDFNLTRSNGIPYASFGLVWKKYSKFLIQNEEIIKMIENKLVLPIDANDNGISLSKNNFDEVYEYTLTKNIIPLFRSTWDEGNKNIDRNFKELLDIAVKIIEREIEIGESLIKGESLVLKFIEKQNEPNILVLDKYLPWERVTGDFRRIDLVVYPDFNDKNWCAEAVRSNYKDYSTNKTFFPSNWGGKMGDELAKVSGVADAVFCHKGLFFIVAKNKEGALELAKKAIKKV